MGSATLLVPVFAKLDASSIKLEPASKLDFGLVAQGWTLERTVTVTNVGHKTLELSSVEVVTNTGNEEFAVKSGSSGDGEFSGLSILEPGQSVIVRFAFSNDGDAVGQAVGKANFLSNDPVTPGLLLDLEAQRDGLPECLLEFQWPVLQQYVLEFGTVAHGNSKTLPLYVKNVGSGYCTWKSALIRDCVSFMGQMTQCTDQGVPSTMFKPVSVPISVKDGIAPGATVQVDVLFTAPTTIPFIPTAEDFRAWLQVSYEENYSTGSYVTHNMPETNAQGTVKANLHGMSGIANIVVAPAQLDFSPTPVGCYSHTANVDVYNAGTAPLVMTDIYLDGCSSAFALKQFPDLPNEVAPSDHVTVQLVFLPQSSGMDSCYLVVESSDMDTPVLKIPLAGEGTDDGARTDEFVVPLGQRVDILFVIDESASMCDQQDALASNIEAMTDLADAWGGGGTMTFTWVQS